MQPTVDHPIRCEACGYCFPSRLGKYGCPNCHGEGLGDYPDLPSNLRLWSKPEWPDEEPEPDLPIWAVLSFAAGLGVLMAWLLVAIFAEMLERLVF